MKSIKNIKLLLFFVGLQFVVQMANAQLPSNDSAWVLQKSLSDDFDTLNINSNKWEIAFMAQDTGWESDGAELDYYRNVKLDTLGSGHMTLLADTLCPWVFRSSSKKALHPTSGIHFAYQGARVTSKTASYQYGYFEINAKYPKGRLFEWPAFWVWNANVDCDTIPTSLPRSWYNEIDICENGGDASYAGNTQCNMHTTKTTPDSCDHWFSTSNLAYIFTHSIDTSLYHKYAVAWNHDAVTYYFDDVPFRIKADSLPTHLLKVIFNFNVYPWNVYLPSDWDRNPFQAPLHWGDPTGFSYYLNKLDTACFRTCSNPKQFKIDYFHYYKLATACTSNTTICSPGNYDRKVQQYLKTNTGCTITYNPSDWNHSYTLRATDYVLLDAPAGTNYIEINPTSTGSNQGYFAIDVIPCPN